MSSSASSAPDFDPLAARYDELRPDDDGLAEALADLGALPGTRVLDVGCGTGRLAAALATRYGCRVWGVDVSRAMLDVARRRAPSGVGLKRASAEDLPFRDGWFDRVTMVLVAHLVDRRRAFGEARRVLAGDGRLVLATFDRAQFDRSWLTDLFPSFRELDRARFATGEELERELRDAGFSTLRAERLSRAVPLARADALERIRGRHISTFQLISEEEFAAGLARAERELPPRVESRREWLLLAAAAG